MKKGKVIFHIDMNSFYASVEVGDDPSLRGKPVAVAGKAEERRGIILTCSYEARALGIHATMPVWEAKKICPQLVLKKPNFQRYREVSGKMFELLQRYSSLVEPVSIDEGYIDMSDCQSPVETAKEIQKCLLEELRLPSSIGIAPNKFLAKMASSLKKPLGMMILRKRDVPTILWPLPVNDMHGVGDKTAKKLNTIGIETIGDLANGNQTQLEKLLGINGLRLKERANGIDLRSVDPQSAKKRKSIGHSTTFSKDSDDEAEIYSVLNQLTHSASERMQQKKVVTNHVQITIRYANRHTITRNIQLDEYTNEQKKLLSYAWNLFLKNWNGDPIRLIGVSGQSLQKQIDIYKQLDLFSYEEDAKDEPLYETIKKLQEKFGDHIIQKGLH